MSAAIPVRRPRGALLLAVVLMAAALVYGVGTRGFALSEPDEARYGEIAREMLESGDWITPRLNYVVYFEKPPLVYWSSALAFAGLGQSEFAARLPVVLSAVLTLALTAWLARRLYGDATALLATGGLAVSPLFGVLAVALTLDMALTACITLAMVCAWHACAWQAEADEPRSVAARTRWVRAAYVATALAMLVKGPVAALLIGAAVFLYAVTHGGLRAVRAWLDWRAFALAAVIALPWFVLVGLRNPGFWQFFIVDQHFTRFVSKREHGQPIWFFLPVLPVALAPWGFVALADPVAPRAAWDPRTWRPGTHFCAIWAAVIVVFFSLSASKLLTYVLPALPALSILCARLVLTNVDRGHVAGVKRIGWLLLFSGLVMGLCAALLPMFMHHWRVRALAPFLFAAALPMAVTGLLSGRLVVAGRARAALAVLGCGWALLFCIAVAGRGAANEYRSLGVAARTELREGDRLALYQKYVQGMPFYAGRRVVLIGGRSELKFGSQQGDHSAWFWSGDEDLIREWRSPSRLFVLFNRQDLDRLRAQLDPPPIEIAAKDKKVLVKNRP
ncbi:MAG: phospholipid carrier-dependent glycosyltransferase [bacterium]